MIFYSELEWALECESGRCSASSRAGVIRAAAWITLAGTIAAIVLDRLRVGWAVAAAAAVTLVALLLWLLLFLASVGGI